jgi:hypothetical protein
VIQQIDQRDKESSNRTKQTAEETRQLFFSIYLLNTFIIDFFGENLLYSKFDLLLQ